MTQFLFPDQEHDYDWHDYEPVDGGEIGKGVLRDVLVEIRRDFIPVLGVFADFTASFVEGINNDAILGRYVDSTYSHPYVALAFEHIYEASDEYDVDFEVCLESTIIHELGHAVQQALGMKPKSKRAYEDQAEALALHWHRYREIHPDFLKAIQRHNDAIQTI